MVRGQSTRRNTLLSTSLFVCRCSPSRIRGLSRFLMRIGSRVTNTMLCIEGLWQIFEDILQIIIYTGHCFLSPAKFEGCVPSDMKIKGTSVSPTLSVDLMLVSTSSPSDICPYLCLPPPVRSMYFSTEVFQWRIAVKATLRGINRMLGVGWLPH